MDIQKVGDFIKSKRKELKLTQTHIADELGVTAQAVSKWERGENMPDVGFIPDIAKMLKVSIEEILQGGGSADETEDIQPDLNSFAGLNPQQKSELIAKILTLEDYAISLDEILPYSGMDHKNAILAHIINRRDFELLEQITTYLDNNMKFTALGALLDDGRYDIIEDIMPIFNRKHRDVIVDFIITNPTEEIVEILENFIPFFDKNQIERLKGGN
ncbi:MAG: helix-turn-helix domain-containing protein [Defluviitaleaceae bacterium]|nr:helix-turn-helix domain-containing protein [Defluviitaleaceae bacterium]